MELINYKTYGDKTSKPLLIIHGMFGSLDNWMTLSKQWSEDFYVIAIDLRNHGRSKHSDEMTFEAVDQDLLELFTHLDIDVINILGHSLGGKVAMHFTENYPERVESMIIVDMAPYSYPDHHNDVFYMLNNLDLTKFTTRAEVEEGISEYFRSPAMIGFMAKNVKRDGDKGYEWKFNAKVIEDNYRGLIEYVPTKTYLGRVLFVAGGESDYITPETSINIPTLYPNFEVDVIAHAGHWLHAEKPTELTKDIYTFLNK